MAGGHGVQGDLSSVEILQQGQWTIVSSLPKPGEDMKSALHGDCWYLIHQDGNVFSASLLSLMQEKNQSPWKTLPNVPSSYSAAGFFGGHLLSIGGDKYLSTTTAIHAFHSSSQSWKHVADLPVPLRYSSATVLPTGELMVVGGDNEDWDRSCKIFISSFEGLFSYFSKWMGVYWGN